jgi:beta-glucosidase
VAQQKIQYQLCGQDFRPLYMHDSLPAGAVYENKHASPEARASDVLRRLSFEEKLTLTGGWKSMHFPGVPELGLPPVYFSDASQGVHVKNICVKVGRSTAFPSELTLAATWNPSLAYQYARDIGEECQAWGINVL